MQGVKISESRGVKVILKHTIKATQNLRVNNQPLTPL